MLRIFAFINFKELLKGKNIRGNEKIGKIFFVVTEVNTKIKKYYYIK